MLSVSLNSIKGTLGQIDENPRQYFIPLKELSPNLFFSHFISLMPNHSQNDFNIPQRIKQVLQQEFSEDSGVGLMEACL